MSDDATPTVTFQLNGHTVAGAAPAKRPLLELLREDLDHRTARPGCSPQGVCGCCAVLVDGKPRLACTLPAKSVEGKAVQTLEGMSAEGREALALAFCEVGAVGAGYNLSGIGVQALALLERHADAGPEDAQKALAMHLTRTVGWSRVVEGVVRTGALLRGAARPTPPADGVGASAWPLDGQAIVRGEVPVLDDYVRPGLLHAVVAWPAVAAGTLTALDVAGARAAAGVCAVVTAADLGGQPHAGDGLRDWPVLVGVGQQVGYAGSALAVVVAETRELAAQAAALVVATVQAGTPELAFHGAPVEVVERGEGDPSFDGLAVGEASLAFAPTDAGSLDAEAALAVPVGSGVHVLLATASPAGERRTVAEVTGLPLEWVTVEAVAGAGAWGLRGVPGPGAWAASAALATGRPVKLALTLQEATAWHARAPACEVTARVGATEDGTLRALEVTVRADGGAHLCAVLPAAVDAAAGASGSWRVPAWKATVAVHRSHLPPAGPIWDALHAQVTVAVEAALDDLALCLSADPFELRLANLVPEARPALEALRPAWQAAADRPRAVAVAGRGAGAGHGRVERATVTVDVDAPDAVTLGVPFGCLGVDLHTLLVQLAATATGLPAAVFAVECRTDRSPAEGVDVGGAALVLAGNALLDACAAFSRARGEAPLGALVGRRFTGRWTAPATAAPGETGPTHLARTWTAALVTATSDGALDRLLLAQEVGRAINPLLQSGHVVAAASAGLTRALSEAVPYDGAVPEARFAKHGYLRAKGFPTPEVLLVESGHPAGPLGALPVDVTPATAVGAALTGLVRWVTGAAPTSWPMNANPVAASLGIRAPRPVKA